MTKHRPSMGPCAEKNHPWTQRCLSCDGSPEAEVPLPATEKPAEARREPRCDHSYICGHRQGGSCDCPPPEKCPCCGGPAFASTGEFWCEGICGPFPGDGPCDCRPPNASPPPQAQPEASDEEELALIDAAFVLAMDALESDAQPDVRRRAFERIQDLYEPDRLMGAYRNRVDPMELPTDAAPAQPEETPKRKTPRGDRTMTAEWEPGLYMYDKDVEGWYGWSKLSSMNEALVEETPKRIGGRTREEWEAYRDSWRQGEPIRHKLGLLIAAAFSRQGER